MPRMFDWRGGNGTQMQSGTTFATPPRPLKVNLDKVTYLARKELQRGRVDDAKAMYTRATEMDVTDGRAWLGLSRCYSRERR